MASLLPSTDFYGSVEHWLAELTPEQVAGFYFTSYNSLLSNMAMASLVQDDFPKKEGDPDTETIQNLRAALTQLYAGSTCTLTREGNRFTLAITVPGGEADTWPEQIAQPGPITYPTVGVLPHEVK